MFENYARFCARKSSSTSESVSAILANMPEAIEAEAWAYCHEFRDIQVCRECGRRECTWLKRFKEHSLDPRQGSCSGSTRIDAKLHGFPHWHLREVKIYFIDSFGSCHGESNTSRARVDAEGWMHFSTPPHYCMARGWTSRCPGDEVFVQAEYPPDSDNRIALPHFRYLGRHSGTLVEPSRSPCGVSWRSGIDEPDAEPALPAGFGLNLDAGLA